MKDQKLSVGEKRNITAQELFLSRNDFQSISAYLTREAEKGHFSISKHLIFYQHEKKNIYLQYALSNSDWRKHKRFAGARN